MNQYPPIEHAPHDLFRWRAQGHLNDLHLSGSIKELKSRMETEFLSEVNALHEKDMSDRKRRRDDYYKTDAGKAMFRRSWCTRGRKFREACNKLSHEELENIKNFYVNCPEGYEVDHIIPLSKGGAHHISNLQYLPWQINAKKHARLPSEIAHLDWYKPYIKKAD